MNFMHSAFSRSSEVWFFIDLVFTIKLIVKFNWHLNINLTLNEYYWITKYVHPCSKKKDIVAEAIRAASHEHANQQNSAAATTSTVATPVEIKKERQDNLPQATAGTSSQQSSTNASQSTSSASPTVVTAVKSEPNAGKFCSVFRF